MRVIFGDRGSGKSLRIRSMLSMHPYLKALIVFPTKRMADYFEAGLKEYNIETRSKCICFEEYITNHYDNEQYSMIIFDEIELCLQQYSDGIPISTMTVNNDGGLEVLYKV